MFFQAALEGVFNRSVPATSSALSIISKSSILSSPFFFSLMMVVLLTFAGLPYQVKLKAILSFLSLNVLGKLYKNASDHPAVVLFIYLFIYLFLLLISYAREKFCLLN